MNLCPTATSYPFTIRPPLSLPFISTRVLFAIFFFFFFQAEDGIRDADVTGVQTCALPISLSSMARVGSPPPTSTTSPGRVPATARVASRWVGPRAASTAVEVSSLMVEARSEERRVGKECRSRGAPEHEKKEGKGREAERRR